MLTIGDGDADGEFTGTFGTGTGSNFTVVQLKDGETVTREQLWFTRNFKGRPVSPSDFASGVRTLI